MSRNSNIDKIFAILAAQNPQPKCELNYTSNFELLIAVILSAQATDIGVNKATAKLFNKANTPETMLQLSYNQLCELIKSIGLYRSKARNILKTCSILVQQHQSTIPSDRNMLEALPGVGRKTANVVLNTAFMLPTIAVDTHVARVSKRLQFTQQTLPNKIEADLYKVIPKKYLMHAHHWLILHGRYICKARTPLCHNCPITEFCSYHLKLR